MFDAWSDATAEALVLANAAAALVMTGLIWFVQIVHYPLLAGTPADRSTDVAAEHQRRTSYVVAVPMAVEGITTLALLVDRPGDVALVWPWLGALLVAIALGSTILLSVPLHARMALAFDPNTGPRLVLTNWPRTVAWTLHGVVGLVMLAP
ncbi:MAG: hypothetical protein B7C54_05145 [Acidimicrobiales bacterium mtb01]|nr:hypothetical protein [Actinomycetota bacterium]TEX46595.1 MAG: hypothetical protein B7C54_05145 [Acidimicrobiales bacterium mtb01]